MKSTHARRVAMLLLAAPLALTACSGSSTPSPSGTSATTSTAALGTLTPGAQVDKTTFFDVTKAAADANKTYAFATQTGDAGAGVSSSGVVDNTDPNNRKRQITLKDDKGESQIVIAGGQVYMKTAAVPGGKWLQAPLNPEVEKILADSSGRVDQNRDLITSILYVGEETLSGVKTRHFTLTLDPSKATATGSGAAATSSGAAATSSGAAAATGGTAATVKIEYWLDDQNRARKRVTAVGGVPTTTTYDKWGEPVTVTVPPSDQVTDSIGTTAPASPAPSASASS